MNTTQQDTQRKEKFYVDLQTAIEIGRNEMILAKAETILYKYIERYYDGGEITPIHIPQNAVGGANLLDYCESKSGVDVSWIDKSEGVMPEHDGPRTLIAKAELEEDVEWEDTDPYQTAGGYKEGIARKGTPVNIYITYDYTGFHIKVDGKVSVTKSHYNNNFFGNSTGNGTKEYEEGEKQHTYTLMAYTNSRHFEDKLTNVVIDFEKLEQFVRNAGHDRNAPDRPVRPA